MPSEMGDRRTLGLLEQRDDVLADLLEGVSVAAGLALGLLAARAHVDRRWAGWLASGERARRVVARRGEWTSRTNAGTECLTQGGDQNVKIGALRSATVRPDCLELVSLDSLRCLETVWRGPRAIAGRPAEIERVVCAAIVPVPSSSCGPQQAAVAVKVPCDHRRRDRRCWMASICVAAVSRSALDRSAARQGSDIGLWSCVSLCVEWPCRAVLRARLSVALRREASPGSATGRQAQHYSRAALCGPHRCSVRRRPSAPTHPSRSLRPYCTRLPVQV